MKEVIFIDEFIIKNFLMNYLLLYIVHRFCRQKSGKWRLIAAAGVGALYVLVVFFPYLHAFYTVLMKFLVSVLMVVIAFIPNSFRDFFKKLLLFYIGAFLIGGCILGIFYLNKFKMGFDKGVLEINVPPAYIITGIIISIVIVKYAFDFYEVFYSREKSRVVLEIHLDKKECQVNAIVDTGNSLRDPITSSPVIVVYYKSIMSILPGDVVRNNREENSYDTLTKNIMESSLKSRIRIIPYKALGVENGILVGLKVDMVVSRFKLKSCIIDKPIIALCNQPISNDDEYQALAYPEIIKGCLK